MKVLSGHLSIIPPPDFSHFLPHGEPLPGPQWFWSPPEPPSRVQVLLGLQSPCPVHLGAQTLGAASGCEVLEESKAFWEREPQDLKGDPN